MKRSLVAVLCSCALVAAACADQAPDPAMVRVGVILAQTGAASFIGEPEAAVLGALSTRATAAGVTLDVRDSGGDATRASAIFDTLAADSAVIAVIGPSTSGESLQLGPRADQLELPMLSLAANKGIVFDAAGITRPWVFKFAQNDALAADRLALAMRAAGDTVVAMLYSDDAFGTGGAEAFRLSARGSIRIATDQAYAAQLQSGDALAAQVGTAPAVIIWGTTPGPPLLVKALRARGYKGRIYLSHGNASGAFVLDAGAAAEGALVVGSRVLLSSDRLVAGRPADDVIREYQTLWAGISTGTPSTFGGHARDALEAIISVSDASLRRMPSVARRRALRDRIQQLNGFVAVTGTFGFSATDHAGLTAEAFELYRIEGGRFVAVRP
jgi:branched-chain amino acid transport system substrate-binding protein